jgi:hypothetical protein
MRRGLSSSSRRVEARCRDGEFSQRPVTILSDDYRPSVLSGSRLLGSDLLAAKRAPLPDYPLSRVSGKFPCIGLSRVEIAAIPVLVSSPSIGGKAHVRAADYSSRCQLPDCPISHWEMFDFTKTSCNACLQQRSSTHGAAPQTYSMLTLPGWRLWATRVVQEPSEACRLGFPTLKSV